MTSYTYERDGAEIYRRSFATIRREADLGRLPEDARPMVVRMIHACGMVDLAADVVCSPGLAAAARSALEGGCAILTDTQMVADGVTRSRLPAANPVVCTLGEPGIAELARRLGTTRSAAAMERWGEALDGAVVAIGNAPTALFRLLELIDAGAPRPAAIVGIPVGFVGAAESKQALIDHPAGVPFVTVVGRRGGSAITAAAVNALACEPRVTATGHLYGVGVGPGDPELLSMKAVRLVTSTLDVAYFAARGRPSNARRVVSHLLGPAHRELRIEYPVTTEPVAPDASYEALLLACYDEAAERVAARLDAGHDVVVLCEGDPLLFGSYMYLHNRLAARFTTTVVPGIGSVAIGPATIGQPLACGDDVLSVLSGVMAHDELKAALAACDAAVIIKLGRNLAKVRSAVAEVGLAERAWYVERASSPEQVCCPLSDADPDRAPYFSMVVIPSARAGRR